MELLLIRHGLPLRIDGADASGPADPGLSPDGWSQAEALAQWLRLPAGAGMLTGREPRLVDAVYASSMQRARETARPLADALDLEVEVRDELCEFDRGANSYIPLEELHADDPRLAQLLIDWDWTSSEIQEELTAFTSGVISTLDTIAADHPSQRVAVACHGGVINAYLGEVLGMGPSLFFRPDYTSVSRVEVSQGGQRTLVSVNETPHLLEIPRSVPRM